MVVSLRVVVSGLTVLVTGEVVVSSSSYSSYSSSYSSMSLVSSDLESVITSVVLETLSFGDSEFSSSSYSSPKIVLYR